MLSIVILLIPFFNIIRLSSAYNVLPSNDYTYKFPEEKILSPFYFPWFNSYLNGGKINNRDEILPRFLNSVSMLNNNLNAMETKIPNVLSTRFYSYLKKEKMNNSNKILPRFMNPIPGFKKKIKSNSKSFHKEGLKKQICKEKNGILFEGECYQLIERKLLRSEAQMYCKSKGGDLWTPNFNDPYLLQKIMVAIPNFGGVRSDQEVWIGVTLDNGILYDLDDQDITNSYFGRMSFLIMPGLTGCVDMIFDFGTLLHSVDISCTEKKEFVCEYPIEIK